MTVALMQPAKPLRTWLPMALWTAGILLALGLAWFVGAVAVPVWQVRAVLDRYPGEAGGELCPLDRAQTMSDIGGLGGPGMAAKKVRQYLQMPRIIADKKQVAVLFLPVCEDDTTATQSILATLAKDESADVRSAALRAIEEFRCLEARRRMLGQVTELLRESGYWRDYPLQSVKYDAKRRQWGFLFTDGRVDSGYAAYIANEMSDYIDIELFPPMWTRYERKKSATR